MPLSPSAERYRGKARRAQKRVKTLEAQLATPEPTLPSKGDLGSFFAWCEDVLRIPTGPLRGNPFAIQDWQRDFIQDALAPGVREAGLSVARKNGKSGLIAALLLAHLVGPLRSPLWRGAVVSLTGGLAAELRHAIEQTAAASGLDGLINVKRSPPPGSIEGVGGAVLTLLASDRATGHAIGADLAVIDEAGLLEENRRELWNAVLSSISGRDGRLICISIQGRGPMFAEMRERRESLSVVWHEYAADSDARLDDPEQWRRANPGLGSIKSLSYMRDAAARAIATPADAPSFRAYDLNLPQDPNRQMICSVQDWLACVRSELPERDGNVILGFDAGYSASMTCLAALWPSTGRMEVWAALPCEPDLLTRSRADGQGDSYCRMQRRGELWTYPGRVTPVAQFLLACADALEGERVICMGADRVRRAEVENVLAECRLGWPVEWRGTGASAFAHGSHDVRAFQRLVLDRRLHIAESLVMASAIAESEIRFDNAGNPALDKSRHKARIDALQASVIAAGLAEIWNARKPKPSRYLGMVEP